MPPRAKDGLDADSGMQLWCCGGIDNLFWTAVDGVNNIDAPLPLQEQPQPTDAPLLDQEDEDDEEDEDVLLPEPFDEPENEGSAEEHFESRSDIFGSHTSLIHTTQQQQQQQQISEPVLFLDPHHTTYYDLLVLAQQHPLADLIEACLVCCHHHHHALRFKNHQDDYPLAATAMSLSPDSYSIVCLGLQLLLDYTANPHKEAVLVDAAPRLVPQVLSLLRNPHQHQEVQELALRVILGMNTMERNIMDPFLLWHAQDLLPMLSEMAQGKASRNPVTTEAAAPAAAAHFLSPQPPIHRFVTPQSQATRLAVGGHHQHGSFSAPATPTGGLGGARSSDSGNNRPPLLTWMTPPAHKTQRNNYDDGNNDGNIYDRFGWVISPTPALPSYSSLTVGEEQNDPGSRRRAVASIHMLSPPRHRHHYRDQETTQTGETVSLAMPVISSPQYQQSDQSTPFHAASNTSIDLLSPGPTANVSAFPPPLSPPPLGLMLSSPSTRTSSIKNKDADWPEPSQWTGSTQLPYEPAETPLQPISLSPPPPPLPDWPEAATALPPSFLLPPQAPRGAASWFSSSPPAAAPPAPIVALPCLSPPEKVAMAAAASIGHVDDDDYHNDQLQRHRPWLYPRHEPQPTAISRQTRIHAMTVLLNLASGDNHHKDVMGACRPLLECCKTLLSPQETSSLLQHHAVATLCHLSQRDENHASLVSFPGLIHALGQQVACAAYGDELVAIQACLTLVNLSTDKGSKAQIYQTPGIMQALLMALHPMGGSSRELRIRACSVLSNLAIGYDNKLPMYYYPGLLHCVLEILSNERDDADLASKACSILWSLAAEKQVQIPLVHEQRRVVPSLIHMVKLNIDSQARSKSWAALTLLAESSENAMPLVRAGVLHPLMDILQAPPGSVDTACLSWCVSCLMNLAQVDQVANILLGAGVVELLESTAVHPSCSSGVMEYGRLKACMAVALICRGHNYSDDSRHYHLFRKMEAAIPHMANLLYNTLAGRGGPGYKYGVFSLATVTACMAALTTGPEYWQEHVCGSIPLLTQLLQVLWDFGVQPTAGTSMVGGGRDDIASAVSAIQAIHAMVLYQSQHDILDNLAQHLVESLLQALHCAELRLGSDKNFEGACRLSLQARRLLEPTRPILLPRNETSDSSSDEDDSLEDYCASPPPAAVTPNPGMRSLKKRPLEVQDGDIGMRSPVSVASILGTATPRRKLSMHTPVPRTQPDTASRDGPNDD